MLIGLCGGICSGKHAVAEYLAAKHGFAILSLSSQSQPPNGINGNAGHAEDKPYTFSDVDELLEFVTKQWRKRWIIADVSNQRIVEVLSRRPFFLLVNVDAPLGLRWVRYQNRCTFLGKPSPTLESFIEQNDKHLYDPESGVAGLVGQADVHLVNSSGSLQALYEGLEKLDLMNEERMRPSWDQYFMQLASLAARRSNCMKRRVGSVLVRERRVISTGYNGTPRYLKNCNEGGCARCNGGQGSGVGLSTCLCLHAEENALLEAGRERIREGSILYCDTCPCLTCSIKITQVGISEVVYSQGYSMDSETAAIFSEAGVTLRQFVSPRKGLELIMAGTS